MPKLDTHREKYRSFKADAERKENSVEIRAEAYFLASYHLVDACAARHNVHIGKHQRVRSELEKNDMIFGKDTGQVWKLFQALDTAYRPKFVYGDSWSERDFVRVREVFEELETVCLKVLK
ncbi:MAG TPA: hypothetical protein VI893_06540 [Thermoplasmata archaeon]|nr:hypothetical protein [Thermoplasmata archaeon]